ncbi:MAG: hypothetical protein LBT33_08190 [Spirochaetia bacterium]|jgi:hypothetical protein|nr:hypothetical protein [Spirochaetia bacterium]
MLVYLNRGLVLEQAVVSALQEYIGRLRIDKVYENFHTRVTLSHPFAHLYLEREPKAGDHFPAIVVSTYDDEKPPEMAELAPQSQGSELSLVGFTAENINAILDVTERYVENGEEKSRAVPGVCTVAEAGLVMDIRNKLEAQEYVYGYALKSYRKDHISIEIWAENIQLKNELYEAVRLFVLGNLRTVLTNRYKACDPLLDDVSVRGQRSGVYNNDFDVVLAGANITFDVNYAVEQIVINTDWEDVPAEIVVKENNYA